MSDRPPPMLDDPGVSSASRALLSAGRADVPSPARVDAIAARVLSMVGPLPPPGGPGEPPPAPPSPPASPAGAGAVAGAPLAAKIVGVVALAASGAGLFWAVSDPSRPATAGDPRPSGSTAVTVAAASDRSSAPSAPEAPAAADVPAAAPSSPLGATASLDPATPPASASSARASSPAAASSASSSAAPSAPPPSAPSASPVPSLSASAAAQPGDEAATLARAQGLLARDPASALAVTDEHAKGFSAPRLVEEREVIAVDALVRLGRREEARARVAQIRARFPRSVYLPRLEALVADR